MTLRQIKAIRARIKLLIGPAAETEMFARSLFRHRNGFVSTGLAHPKQEKPPRITPRSGNKTVPTGSICASGLSDILPCKRPVSSPNRSEVQACAISWNEREKIKTTNHRIKSPMGTVKSEFKSNAFTPIDRWLACDR